MRCLASPRGLPPLVRLCVAAALALLILPSCASSVPSDHERVRIETDPPGAEVVSVEGEQCTTPCELLLPKLRAQRVALYKEGFEAVEVDVLGRTSRNRVVGSIASNFVFGAVVIGIGAIIGSAGAETVGEGVAVGGLETGLGGGVADDYASGALLKLAPNPVRILLAPAFDRDIVDQDEAAGDEPVDP
jgi:hypothetical protein